MAFHPFRTFQRNQKGCMAGATLLAMISFLFLGVIIQMVGGGRGGPESQIQTIAESRRFGKVTSMELYRLQESHEVFKRFLTVLHQNLARDLIMDFTPEDVRQHLYPLESFIGQVAQLQNPEQLINVWLVTQYAEEEGLAPTWDDAKTLLKQLTNDYLSDAVYDETLQSIGHTHQQIAQLFIQHLRWRQSLERFGMSVSAVSPATRWDWYQRLHRQVTIEAAAVPIDSLIDQVGEPTTAQLTALFEKYQNRRYNPASTESGFIMPTELAFQYIVADPSQEMLDSITEEEMLAFYEENKDVMFRKPDPSLRDMQFPGMPGGGMPMFPTLPGMDTIVPQTEEIDEPQTLESGEEESETSAVSRVTTLLVSYQAEEDPADDTGGLAPSAPVPDALDELEEESDPVDLSILYKPFDEVKDDIRKGLAIKKAAEGLPIIQEKMKEYAAIYNENFEQSKPTPAMPDLAGLVAEQGLQLVTIPMGDVYAVLRTDLARGLNEREHLVQMFRNVPLPFEGTTFWGDNGPILYWVIDQKMEKRPEKLDEVKDAVVKRWKEIEAKELALKKAEELANEAKASGKSLAEQFASRSDLPVVETEPFTWRTYGTMNFFTAVMQRMPPMLGEVREKGVAEGDSELDNTLIAAPGSDFMETVYSLQIGETGVVFNQPQTVAYIVRITSSSPSTESLWERFQSAHMLEYLYAGQPEMVMAAREAWLDEIRNKTGFRWVNKPDAREIEMHDDY